MRRMLAVWAENGPCVAARVTGVVRRSGLHLEILTVRSSDDPELSCFTLVVAGDDERVERLPIMLEKLIQVHPGVADHESGHGRPPRQDGTDGRAAADRT